MTKPTDVDSYIANAFLKARPTLKELREIITSTVPEAEEGISYNVPLYKFHGVHVGFSVFKNHATIGIGADILQKNPQNARRKRVQNRKGHHTNQVQSKSAGHNHKATCENKAREQQTKCIE